MRRFPLPLLLLAALAAVPVASQAPPPPGSPAAVARARTLIENPDAPAGDLPVECWVHLEQHPGPAGAAAGDTGPGTLSYETFVDLEDLPEGAAPLGSLRITLAAATIEGRMVSSAETVTPTTTADDGAAADAWLYRGRLALPDDLHGAAVVVEEALGTHWGACVAELADGPLHLPAGMRVAIYAPRAAAGQGGAPTGSPARTGPGAGAPGAETAPRGPRGAIYPQLPGETGSAPAPGPAGAASAPSGPPGEPALPTGGRLLVILPPRKRPATGKVEIQTLVTTDAVAKVVFYLDGTEAGSDEREPFNATLDLGSEPTPHTIRAVALGRDGHELGRHEITVNQRVARFDVRISALQQVAGREPGGAGAVAVEARVSVPAGASVARVEFYRNQELLATETAPPWRATLPLAAPAPAPDDYVRVVAYLADGSSLEDVQLLSQGVPAARVEVNLVQLFVVVTSEDGEPVQGLTKDDFQVRLRGQVRPIERFQVADDVPLTLGLLIDTSQSMWVLMTDAEQAAARFLINTLIPGDRAFLADFSDRPHLIQQTTGDVNQILQRFSRLQAGGATALYDSIVFSTVQLWDQPGRRAVVLLTDGDDTGSRMPTRRAIQYARLVASPVYIVSLAGLYSERGNLRKVDLEAITEHTGGRIYYIKDIAKLGDAYDQINRELRSQYVLAFATDRPLTEDEVDDISVKVDRPGVDVRTAVGSE